MDTVNGNPDRTIGFPDIDRATGYRKLGLDDGEPGPSRVSLVEQLFRQ